VALPAVAGTGIMLMLLAQLVVMPSNDAAVKYLSASLPAEQLAWARFAVNFLLLAPVAFWRYGAGALAPARPGLQLVRGLVIIASNLFFIAGIRTVPLADAMALVFVAPLAVAALSPLVLGERVGRGGWIAVLVGLAGALVIVRPGFGQTDQAALLPLAAGFSFAAYLLITRKLAGTTPPLVTQTVTAAIAGLVASATLPFVWVVPTPFELALMLAVGIASCVGHLLITVAHEHAKASTLAPLTYLSIITATIYGYLLFADLPDLATWTGAAIVIASGLYLWWSAGQRA
jgi:drug/metabolite transporter (DMT)-like permease